MMSGATRASSYVLAVIVPAYNVEDYIDACLASVLGQATTFPLELIVVVDGATDGTLAAAQATVRRYPGVDARIIVQSNQGLSAARNAGIAAATARYVAFLDGDDVWLPGYARCLAPILAEDEHDLIEFDALMIDEIGETIGDLKIASAKIGEVRNIDRSDFLQVFRCYAWARVYARRLFDAISFPAGRRFEDTATIPWSYWRARSILSVGEPLIGYRQRHGSILASPKATDIDDILATAASATGMLRESGDHFWRHVSARALQQACSRIQQMPLATWPSMARKVREGVSPDIGAGASVVRRLQFRYPLAYVLLLYVKRRTVDKIDRFLSKRGTR